MKKEKTIKTYQRRTKSGKMVTVRQHTAKYDAAEKAKEAAKKKGAGDELEERKKKRQLEISFDEEPKTEKEILEDIKEEESKSSKKRPVGSGTNGPESKKEAKPKKVSTKKEKSKDSPTSETAFTAAEFKEWYQGTGSAADKKVAKALRAQLGRSGYKKLEDEAIDNYTPRGHLKMFKRVSDGAVSAEATKPAKAESKKPTKAETSSAKDSIKGEPNKGYEFSEKELKAYGRRIEGTHSKYVGGPGPASYQAALKKRKEALAEYHETDEGKAMKAAYAKYRAAEHRAAQKRMAEKAKERKLSKARELVASADSKTKSSTTKTSSKSPSIESLEAKGYIPFKDYGTTLYIGKRGKPVYMKTSKGIIKADRGDYEDFVTGHNGLSKSVRKKLESLGWHEHEEY